MDRGVLPRTTKVRADLVWVVGALAAAIAAALAATKSLAGVIVFMVLAVAMPIAVRAASGDRTGAEVVPTSLEGQVERDGRRMWVPLWISLAWLIGTYGAFWTTGFAARVTDPARLHMFVGLATAAFALGYSVRIKRHPAIITVAADDTDRLPTARRLILAGAIYLAVFGIVQMSEYGATSIASVVQHIQNPGDAYKAKFGVYELQEATGRVSTPMQVITLAGALYGVAAPLLVLYWRRLTVGYRVAGVLGLAMFALYFLFIGTQKGLGDIVVMLAVGLLSGTCGTWWVRDASAASVRRKRVRYAAIAGLAFVAYVVSAQAQRAQAFGTQDVTPPSPMVASVIGEQAATGVSAALFYPTHGYLGLSYNLGTPFQWTKGLGSSPAVASYASQYLGTPAPDSYPARTELRTGWPAGLYWATIYPWLASDLTFPGTVVFMFLFGWVFAWMWVEGAMKRDTLALVIFGQLAVAVAYIPANNQLGASRPVTIGMVTLVAFYVIRSLGRRTGALQSGPQMDQGPAPSP